MQYGDKGINIPEVEDGFFQRFIEELLTFFENGRPPVPKEETLEIMAIILAGNRALKKTDQWVRILD